MTADIDPKVLREKAVDMAFAARTVIQQLAQKDRSAEAFAAQDILEKALTAAIPDGPTEKGK